MAPIELVHPDGAPQGTTVVGEHVPDWLIPEDARRDDQADLVLVAADLSNIEKQERAVADRLSETGIVIALGRSAARRALATRLAERGMTHRESLTARHRRRGRSIGVAVGGGHSADPSRLQRVARSFHPTDEILEATVLRRDKQPPLAGWLPGRGSRVQIRTGWRGRGDAAVASRSEGDALPTVYAKLGLSEATADVGTREVSALRALGDAARVAGARVPDVRDLVRVAGRAVALLTVLEGRPVARTSRRSIRASGEETVEWLRRFVEQTQGSARALPVIEATVLGPARLVVRRIDGGTAYVESLRRLAGRSGDSVIPVAAAHGDLTLWNVLGGERPGILDWEGAHEIALPFVDLPYLLVDTNYWRARRRDRVAAFRQCFPEGQMTIDGLARGGPIGFELPGSVLELAFHACWLGHAANEVERGVEGPFLEILRTIARRTSL